MEIVEVIKDLISTVGFPIVAFLLMVKQNKDLSATIRLIHPFRIKLF